MQFLNPGAFLILGVIPLLLLIHSLKPKPEQKLVTNLFIWKEVLREQKGGFQIKRILRNISLLLQIVIIILTAIAMSSPFTVSNRKAPGNAILVMDTSASMKTKTGNGTRFSQARQKAYDLIGSIEENSRITLIEAGSQPSVKTLKSKNRDDLNQIISDLKAKDTPGNMEKSIYLALSFMDQGSNDTIYFITDGCIRHYADLISVNENIIPVLIEGGEKNTGITRFEFRQLPGKTEHFQVMVEVKNFNHTPVVFPFSIWYENKIIFNKTIGLAENEKKIMILPFDGILSGSLKAEIEAEDDFMVDNQAYGVISDNQKTWVLLITQGNFFLEKLLSVSPDIYVNTISEIQASTWPTLVSENDIIILDNIPSPPVQEGNFLFINTIPEGLPFHTTGQVIQPEITDQALNHPILNHVNLVNLMIDKSMNIKTENKNNPLITSGKSGLLYTHQSNDLKAVLLGFDIEDSDLPFKVAFPVLTHNILTWLYPERRGFTSAYTPAGTPHQEIIRNSASEISVKKPSGIWEKFPGIKGKFIYDRTDETGIYRIIENNRRHLFAVNLSHEYESDIVLNNYPDTAEKKSFQNSQNPNSKNSKSYYWQLFLFLVTGLVLVEFYIWTNRHGQRKPLHISRNKA